MARSTIDLDCGGCGHGHRRPQRGFRFEPRPTDGQEPDASQRKRRAFPWAAGYRFWKRAAGLRCGDP
ncbi:MAG: hypothetical protein OXC62_06435 [Aestuariivita sp.]|nr:hypothetical protein [Aestuariivita sp.]